MRKYLITTPYGNSYYVHDNGDIERTDMAHTPSHQWKFEGIASTHPFSNHIRRGLEGLEALASGEIDTLYKNGRPRWTVADYDHGTSRVWGNSNYHGIKTVSKVEA